MKTRFTKELTLTLFFLITGAISAPVSVEAAAGDNCATDIVADVPDNFDWSQVFIVRGTDGSAWQRAVISNGGGIFQLDEFKPTNVYGTAAPYAPVQVFVFTPRFNATGGLRKPDVATCFEADTRWTTTESDIAVQIGSGYFSLPIASRFLWPNIGNDIILDAFYKLDKPWEAVMHNTQYRGNQNFMIGSHIAPTTLKIYGTRDKAVCKEICDGGPAVGVDLDPLALPAKLRATNFDAVGGRQVIVGRMPGVHTFYSGFKDGSTEPIADKTALRRIAHKALGMEAFKRALLGNLNTRGRPPGLDYLSISRLEGAVDGTVPVSVDTRQLLRYAAVLLIGDRGNPQASEAPYFETPERDSGFNINRPVMGSATPAPAAAPMLGATAKPTINPIGGGATPIVPGANAPTPTPLFQQSSGTPGFIVKPNSLSQFDQDLPGLPPAPPEPFAQVNQTMPAVPPPAPMAPAAPPALAPPTTAAAPEYNSDPSIAPPTPPSTPRPLDWTPGPGDMPPTVPRIPRAPMVPPPGISIFDGVTTQASLQQLGIIINRGRNQGLMRELFPEHVSTETTWAADLITLISFWTGDLRMNNCLLHDDRFLDENFWDQPAPFSAVQCEKYPYVTGMTPLLLVTRDEEITLTPDFHDATIVSAERPFDSGESWTLPKGKKTPFGYLYEFTTAAPEQRIGEYCAKRSELPELITALEKTFSLSTDETNAVSRELHTITPAADGFISFSLADPKKIAERIIWNGNGNKLDILQLFFDIDAGGCNAKSIPQLKIDGYADRDGIEAGLIK